MYTDKVLTPIDADKLCQLVHGAQNNDPKAMAELCEQFKPLILSLASKSYFREYLGEDVTNEAWLIFIIYIKKYKGNNFQYLPGLIKTHLRFELIKRCQKIKSLLPDLSLDSIENEEGVEVPDNQNLILEFETRRLLEDMLKRLPPSQRIVLRLVFLEGKSLKEASKIICKSYESTRSLYHRGLRNIKKL